ncbi:MAG: mechanosensitive ion channel family protein [Sphingomonadales bacterium]|nr:mechanosensitive ion channel family protein [Sphingomonadales bacterium]
MISFLQSNSWADQTYLQWLFALGVLVGTVLFRMPFANFLNWLFYRAFSEKNIKKRKRFHELTGRNLRRLLVLLACYIALSILSVPEHFQWFGKPYHIRFYMDIALQLGLIWTASKILLRIADFVSEVWQDKSQISIDPARAQWGPYIKDGIKVAVILSAFLFVIGIVFQANIAALVGGLGIGGLAVALAAQESLANLLGSFTIFLDKPFTIGDTIEFKGITGTVEHVGFRSTRMRTLDKSYVTVPNKALVTEPLNNITESTHRRAAFKLGLVYQTKPETLRVIIQSILSVLQSNPLIEENPSVTFFGYGESSLDLQIIYLVKTPDYNEYLQVREFVNFEIYRIVDEHDTDFAFPTRTMVTVHDDGTKP